MLDGWMWRALEIAECSVSLSQTSKAYGGECLVIVACLFSHA